MNEIDQEQARKVLYAFLVEEGILFRYTELCKYPIDSQEISQNRTEGTDFLRIGGYGDTEEGGIYWKNIYSRWRWYLTEHLGIDCTKHFL